MIQLGMTDSPAVRELLNSGELQLDYLEVHGPYVQDCHLNRPGWREGRLIDAHLALEEDDYQLFEQILYRCQPWSVTLEYNHDPVNILSQIRRLREILNR